MSPTIAEFVIGLLVAVLAFYWGVKVAPVLLRALRDWLQRSRSEAETLDSTPPKIIDGEAKQISPRDSTDQR